jgi:hypothetical protein
MKQYLQALWFRLINRERVRCLELRCKQLEGRMQAVEQSQHAMLQRFPEPEAIKPAEVKVKLSRPWPQRRAYLEATDGGRLKPEVTK